MRKAIIVLFILCSSLAALPQDKLLLKPNDTAFKKQAPAAFKVLLKTTRGNILLELKREWSPNGVDRFYNLVQRGYYNDAAFFRVRAKLWAQFGIAADPAIARTGLASREHPR